MIQDLTRGSVPKKLITFAMPIFFANVLQSCYNITDMIVVGRFVGSAGLSAISSAAMVCYIITSVCTGVTMGGSVLVSQYKGAKNMEGVKKTAGTLFSLSFIAAIIVTAISYLIYNPVFNLMNVPAQAMKYANDYMLVICGGIVFVFGYNAVCSVLRGMGDSKSPLIFVAVTTVVNIVLDLLLVGAFHMGTSGAALATIISQGISFFVAVWFLKRSRFVFDFRFKSFKIKADICKIILKIGLPSAVQMAVLNLSYLLITGMLNTYGVVISAAAGVGLKINTFAVMPCWAVGQAVTTMTGQNMGARNIQRAHRACLSGVKLNLIAAFVMTALFQAFAPQIVSLFDTNPAVIEQGVLYLRICCSANCFLYAVMYTIDSFATGAGCATFAMFNSILHSVVMRLIISIILVDVFNLGFVGLYWAECLSPLLPTVAGIIFFRRGKWKNRKIM